ncbi:MAG: hypothetical protein CMF69_09120 [Magnetovibrio sp.]|nr:hypothetical protein [Magnetovibrio sp.]|tara:strand:+ start:169 stop:1587 length:1419 start_codon:yes stop_codon:yes gene_type:complete
MVLLIGMIAATTTDAHAFETRYDLPLPLTLFITGAGAAVLLSFVIVVNFVKQDDATSEPMSYDLLKIRGSKWFISPLILNTLRIISVAIFGLLIMAGLFGEADPSKNILPTFLWVIWWVGMAFISALIGNFWALINPWKVIFVWFKRVVGGFRCFRNYPIWLGQWPSVILFLVFAWLELVSDQATDPLALGVLIVIYSGITWLGMTIYGMNAWLKNGEIFTVFFGIFSRFAPIARNANRLDLQLPAIGLLDERPVPFSAVCFVLLLLTTVTFDGILETPMWVGILDRISNSTSIESSVMFLQIVEINLMVVAKTTALIVFPCIFLGIFCAFGHAMAAFGGGKISTLDVIGYFVMSLVPIAIAYHISHYLSYLLITGQKIIPLLSDPFGFGWNLFNTVGYQVDISIINAKMVWYTAVINIVAGHVFAVYIAHLMAIRVFTERDAALRSQIPMLVLMVAYTMISLWVMSQPIVN